MNRIHDDPFPVAQGDYGRAWQFDFNDEPAATHVEMILETDAKLSRLQITGLVAEAHCVVAEHQVWSLADLGPMPWPVRWVSSSNTSVGTVVHSPRLELAAT